MQRRSPGARPKTLPGHVRPNEIRIQRGATGELGEWLQHFEVQLGQAFCYAARTAEEIRYHNVL